MKKLTLKIAILLAGAAVLAPLTTSAAEPANNALDAGTGQKPCELERNFKVTMEYLLNPEAGHDSWTESYNNPELYEWLLQQKRAAK